MQDYAALMSVLARARPVLSREVQLRPLEKRHRELCVHHGIELHASQDARSHRRLPDPESGLGCTRIATVKQDISIRVPRCMRKRLVTDAAPIDEPKLHVRLTTIKRR